MLVGALGAGMLTTGLVGSAAADIGQQIRQSQAQLEQLNRQAERAAEHYNAGRIQLVKARDRASVAQAAAAKLDGVVRALRKQAGAFAAQVYRSGSGSGMDMSSLTSTAGPATFLDRVATLDRISRRNTDVLGQLATARHRQAQAAADAAAALAEAARTLTGLEADKKAVLRSAHQAQAVLAGLQAKQAQLIRAAANAAARRAAQARAAELARQAALNAAATAAFSTAGSGLSTVNGPTRHYSGSAAHIALQVANDQLGKPYTWGAAGPDTFDCSGLTMYAYGKAGISLPHYTGDQWNAGRHVARSELVPGDLVFFGQDLGHMGMYVGNNQFIHAPHSGDVVKISSLTGYYQDNYAGAVRVAG
jgi:cell wall-associated NlpC family hydrolase/DNA-directed RNA polymerase subunit H (RpoH/RPB5)